MLKNSFYFIFRNPSGGGEGVMRVCDCADIKLSATGFLTDATTLSVLLASFSAF